jgi:hypothetical protein
MSQLPIGLADRPEHETLEVARPVGPIARVRVAVAVVAREPLLWALGALSFAIRGGWFLLAVPIITLPEESQLSTIFAPVLTTSGPSSGVLVLLGLAVVAALAVAVTAIVLAAYAEVSAFDRAVRRPETIELRSGRAALELGSGKGLVTRVAGVQASGLLATVVAAGLAGRRIPQIVVSELQFPSNATDSLVERVLGQVRGDLLVVVALVVVVDILVALASRRLMARRLGLTAATRPGPVAMARRLPRLLLTAVACWGITLAALVPILWAIELGWAAVRDVFLAPGGASGPEPVQQLLTLVGFVLLWIAGLALAGLASALRAALWTTAYLR